MTTSPTATPEPSGGACFELPITVHFSNCDPAGMVFFPQYFIMLNNCVETWFTTSLGVDYAQLITNRRVGLPTVQLSSRFVQPSYMGEQVVLRLRVRRLGGRSITLEVGVYGACANDVRAVIEQTLVSTSLDTQQSIALPSDVVRAVHAGGYVAAG
jgi:4-hydroxybenzoyl-CoA thioesterase